MNKAVLATMSFALGAGFGFALGYYINKKDEAEFVEPIPVEKPEVKPEKTREEKMAEEVNKHMGLYNEIFKPAKIAKPDEPGINYTEYVKDLKYKQETQVPPDDDPDDEGDILEDEVDPEEDMNMEDFEETYEERLERENEEALEHSERYKRDHKGKIELMTSDEWDTDFPETDYEREDLYYFTESDVLTDEDGNHVDEIETIGPKPRQVGWMQSSDEVIYVRNHPKEKEYKIFKERCAVEDWF